MTIYDIAREAGVSASSVSRVINQRPGVNPKSRERILALLQKYHYVPDEAARGLVTNNTHLVGILLSDIRHPHHITGAYAIAEELGKRGYTCLVLNAGSLPEEQINALLLLEKRKVEGAVLMGSIFQRSDIADTLARDLTDIPVMMLNGTLDLPNCYSVLTDDRGGFRDCVEFLHEQGCRKLAMLSDQGTPSNQEKIAGFREAVEKCGVQGTVLEEVTASLDGGEEAVKHLFQFQPDTDGVICSQDIIACGAVKALRKQGVEVPRQVRVIGTDDTVYAKLSTPELTSLDTRVVEAGLALADGLAALLQGKEAEKRVVLPALLHVRETT